MKLSASLPDELVERLDAARGDVPRSTWLRRAVEERLGGGVVVGSMEPVGPAEAALMKDVFRADLRDQLHRDVVEEQREAREADRVHHPKCRCWECAARS